MVALKDTEAAFAEFSCLHLIVVLSTLDDVVLLCPWSVALVMHLINLQFENTGMSSSLVSGGRGC